MKGRGDDGGCCEATCCRLHPSPEGVADGWDRLVLVLVHGHRVNGGSSSRAGERGLHHCTPAKVVDRYKGKSRVKTSNWASITC